MKTRILLSLFSAFSLSIFSLNTYGQHDHSGEHESMLNLSQNKFDVEYGSNITVDAINLTTNEANWILSGEGVAKNGAGNSTGAILMEKPGVYTVQFKVINDDGELETAIASINVRNLKVKFNVQQAVFSKPIVQNESISNIILTIPVEITTYAKDEIFNYPITSTTVTGVDGLVISHPIAEQLTIGTHSIKYNIAGTATNAGPAQIGFFNHIGEGSFLNFIVNKGK